MSSILSPGGTRQMSPSRRRGPGKRRGQALVESALALLPFLALVVGAFDFGQVLITHQMMVERVRGSLRWAVTQPYDGTGTQIRNLILYDQTATPTDAATRPRFLNLEPSNIQVNFTASASDDPSDNCITVSIVNYPYKFVSPWIAATVTGARPVVQSAAMLYRP
jgi:Flp pilus assembly protein TadG